MRQHRVRGCAAETELSYKFLHFRARCSGFSLRFLLSETETWLKYRRAIIPGGSGHFLFRQTTADKASFCRFYGPFGLKIKRRPKKTNYESGVSVSRSVTVPGCWAPAVKRKPGYFGIFSNGWAMKSRAFRSCVLVHRNKA